MLRPIHNFYYSTPVVCRLFAWSIVIMLCTKCSAECVVTLSLAKPGSCVCLDMFLSLDCLVTATLCFWLVRWAALILMEGEGRATESLG
jgi:hypothetical protein